MFNNYVECISSGNNAGLEKINIAIRQWSTIPKPIILSAL